MATLSHATPHEMSTPLDVVTRAGATGDRRVADATGAGLWRDFSPLEGGPLHRALRFAGLPAGHAGVLYGGLVIGAIAWAPLFVLAAIQGHLTTGSPVPFLDSLGTHARLLITIPAFSAAEAMFNARVRRLVRNMITTPLVPHAQWPRFESGLAEAIRWRDSWLVEAVVLGLTLFVIRKGAYSDLPPGIATWRGSPDGAITLAGWWYRIVSLPVFQFLLWRWCARLMIWWRLLWRINRLDLSLVPTHPDSAGGLGGLGVVHLALWPLSAGASTMVVATFAEEVLFAGADIHRFVVPLAGMIVGLTAVLVAPLLMFMARLFDVKERGLLEYGALAQDYVSAFEAKWLRAPSPPDEPLLGSSDLQSLADLSNSFNIIRGMRVVPIGPSQIVTLVAAAMAPALPLVLFVVPLNDLILRGVQAFLHV